MRLIGCDAETFLAILFILRIIAVEPEYFALPLERKDVCRDPVEKPPVVRDHNGATGKIHKRLFEGPERVDVEVVRRFVQ